MLPALAASASAINIVSTRETRFIYSMTSYGRQSCSSLIDKLQTGRHRVGSERLGRQSVRTHRDRLLRPDLIFKRRFDVGMDQELHARGEAVARGIESERKISWAPE